MAGRSYITLNPGPVTERAKSSNGTAYTTKAMTSPAALKDKDGKPPPPADREDIDGKRRRRRICVCTRVHQNNGNRPVDMAKVTSVFFSPLAVLGLASSRGMHCTIDCALESLSVGVRDTLIYSVVRTRSLRKRHLLTGTTVGASPKK